MVYYSIASFRVYSSVSKNWEVQLVMKWTMQRKFTEMDNQLKATKGFFERRQGGTEHL